MHLFTLLGHSQAVTMAQDCVGTVGATSASPRILPAVPSGLSQDQRNSLTTLLIEYQDIFAQDNDDIGRTHLAEHATEVSAAQIFEIIRITG